MILVLILTTLIGLCVGSFLNVVIYRVPNNLSIANPPSHCPHCKTPLRWKDNIPVLSFLFLRGKCRYCGASISTRYICVELLNAALWVLCAWLFWQSNIVVAICMMFACSTLLAVAFVDFQHKWIPDRFQIALLVLGIVVTIFDASMPFWHHLVGLGVGLGVMLAVYGLGYLIYKREAMGIGDIKLMAVCGLLLGWQGVLIALFLGVVIGAVGCSLQRVKNPQSDSEYAFAPYLVIGTILAMFLAKYIIAIYSTIL